MALSMLYFQLLRSNKSRGRDIIDHSLFFLVMRQKSDPLLSCGKKNFVGSTRWQYHMHGTPGLSNSLRELLRNKFCSGSLNV